MKHSKFALGLLVAAPIVTVAALAFANTKHAALAYSDARHHYGWAADKATQEEAEHKAMEECGKDCTVRLHWDHGCGAYAEGSHHEHFGWATGATREAVEHESLGNCEKLGGHDCKVKVWACN
jgi:hypothetical protein